MEDRLQRWYRGKASHPDPDLQERRLFVAGLVNKSRMHSYAEQMNLPLPKRYAEGRSLDDLDFSTLPDRVVIKPNNLSNNKGVLLFDREREAFSGDDVPISERRAYVTRRLGPLELSTRGTTFIAEEFIQDFDDRFAIPRDFKVFVAGGRAHVVQVVDRNAKKVGCRHRFYSRDWVAFSEFQKTNAHGNRVAKPRHYRELLSLSDKIAHDIQCFMRLDFYITKRGVVFGEFTSYPNAGNKFTPLGSHVLCDLMDRFPDPF
ncbi:ATP-grasp fold amidoligase family protein [Nioella nitratireducens]|uniref:ATP-grasp fold amidoligase family protein n=1 Tax=Nioella nitratireducens TaxID=1287720 RepID=UPI0008FCF3F8|nr:ATP-grasp fold amidoligase family protein [Nioella nitratireducens]